MEYKFFYISIAVVWLLLIICSFIRPLKPRHLVTAIAAAGFSIFFDSFFGEYLDLYYYNDLPHSLLYIIISALLLYPEVEIVYLLFLPEKAKPTVVYTALWLVLMILFEIASLWTKTIVFTGWRLIPWSIVTYLVTFLWLNLFYRYLKKKGL